MPSKISGGKPWNMNTCHILLSLCPHLLDPPPTTGGSKVQRFKSFNKSTPISNRSNAVQIGQHLAQINAEKTTAERIWASFIHSFIRFFSKWFYSSGKTTTSNSLSGCWRNLCLICTLAVAGLVLWAPNENPEEPQDRWKQDRCKPVEQLRKFWNSGSNCRQAPGWQRHSRTWGIMMGLHPMPNTLCLASPLIHHPRSQLSRYPANASNLVSLHQLGTIPENAMVERVTTFLVSLKVENWSYTITW